jgi:flagellar basal-body rod modification protein FlgD
MDVSATAAAASQTTKAKTTLSGNFDTFLRLLTTQLQNQDPLEPLDATKFTEQLVSYSQVEQQISTNANLEALLALTKAGAGTTAVGYLGKTAFTAGPQSSLDDGAATWRYKLTKDATNVQLSILDSAGKVVRSLPGERNVGTHEFVWDGKNGLGVDMPEGSYKLAIVASTADGKPLTAAINGVGMVNEVDMSGAEPMVTIANRVVKLSDILGLKN